LWGCRIDDGIVSHGRYGAVHLTGQTTPSLILRLRSGASDMIAIITILATAAVTFLAHLVYGAILAGREYNRSEEAWKRTEEPSIPKRTARRSFKALLGRPSAIRT
jgi:hypothetical protein